MSATEKSFCFESIASGEKSDWFCDIDIKFFLIHSANFNHYQSVCDKIKNNRRVLASLKFIIYYFLLSKCREWIKNSLGYRILLPLHITMVSISFFFEFGEAFNYISKIIIIKIVITVIANYM